MQTKSQIVAEVAARIANKGLSVSEIRHSYDAVMGEGAYEKLASDLYDAFRAEGTK